MQKYAKKCTFLGCAKMCKNVQKSALFGTQISKKEPKSGRKWEGAKMCKNVQKSAFFATPPKTRFLAPKSQKIDFFRNEPKSGRKWGQGVRNRGPKRGGYPPGGVISEPLRPECHKFDPPPGGVKPCSLGFFRAFLALAKKP